MKDFNELPLLELAKALKHVDQVFDGPFHGSIRFLDQARADCRLVREIVEGINIAWPSSTTSSFLPYGF